jgi:hypothetical protein
MPSLYYLRPNFDLLNPVEKQEFISKYRKRRAVDMLKPATYGATASYIQSTNTKLKNIGLTPEEIEICKALGLKPKDILKLKENSNDN